MLEHMLQAPVIGSKHSVEKALEGSVQPSMALLFGRPKKAAAKHRSQCQRHKAGNQYRHADRHGEFVKQAPDDSSHEKDGYEYGCKRQCHRDDCKTDLASAVERRLEHAFSHLHVAHDALEHDDGDIYDEADGQR